MKDSRFRKMKRGKFVPQPGPQGPRGETPRIRPSADARLKKVFARIGAPPKAPFKPDPFQLEALAAIGKSDCLVSAPTGSGKTWIAQEAIRRVRKKGGKAWYASPLKALSNSKRLEFSKEFGSDQVGILTGDRKENAEAPIIVGTTEILRNQLYDAMHEGVDLAADLVILDEAHFLGDEDRGVVWEEIMIYLPVRVHLLLLSATIGNAREIADWLESIRSKSCVLVEETGRPVPLFPLFFHPSGRLLPLVDSKGMDKKVRTYVNSPNPPVLSSPRSLPPFGEVLRVLRKYDLLPAIFFMKSRADCDGALDRAVDGTGGNQRQGGQLGAHLDQLIETHPHLATHRQLWHLRNGAVGAHHSGQLPVWKLVIEDLMTEALLDAVFATSTVAAGVNFPARSVVFLNSDRYNGHEFVPLNGTEFHQTTGRAGRRGKDRIGFALVVPGKFMDVRLMADLYTTPPEDVRSQIKVDFSMVLNLLLSHNPDQIREIFQRSFATYLNLVNQEPGLERKLKKSGRDLMGLLPDALCPGPEFVLDLIRKRRALIHEIKELHRRLKKLEIHLSKLASLVPGRLFWDRRGRTYCAMKRHVRRGEEGFLACRVRGGISLRGKYLKMRWFRPQKVSKILDKVVDLPSQDNPLKVRALLAQTAQEAFPSPLESLPLGEKALSTLSPLKTRALLLEEELDGLICRQCRHFKTCHGKPRGGFRRLLDGFALTWDRAHAVRMGLWNDFARHLAFLKEEGFVTEENTLTHDGMWASQLRLDQPLMIAEGLRKGVFPDSDPALFAALVAPFVHDRDVDVKLDESAVPKRLLASYDRMKKALAPLVERKVVRGFEVRPISLWPAATIYGWANGLPWDKVLEIAGMAEGDLAMLVTRTAENLRQVASLTKAYPGVAQKAFEAIAIILRAPVVVN
ncbi:MAG: DEAD/DEAH box helicase [Thermodesulfobacteriota bacterium]|nr:DEAD/DEAH box helicase [Thermodesulfobacteriota bacterium]